MAQGTIPPHVVILNRRGRKRKSGRRYDGGKLVCQIENVMAVVLAQPHRRNLPKSMRLDQKAESALGRLNLNRAIADREYEAGVKYADAVRRYRAVISAADPTLRPTLGSGFDMTTEDARKRKETYDRAFEAMHDAGQRAQRAVARVAVYGELCPPGTGLDDLRRGLRALAKHFGLR